MEILTLRGIVLREYPVGENDKFIHVFTTEHGVIDISVRGGRKMLSKSAGASQLFAYSDFSVKHEKGKYYLDSCEPISLFYKIRNDLERLSLAQYISEVVGYVAGNNSQKKDVMRLLLNTFHFLAEGTRSCQQLKSIFEMRFMSEIGMMPDIVCCHMCMSYSAPVMYFDLLSTRLTCSRCLNHSMDETYLKVSESVVHALRHIVFTDFNRLFNFKLSDANMKKLGQITERYLLMHLGRNFKTLDFYKSLEKYDE